MFYDAFVCNIFFFLISKIKYWICFYSFKLNEFDQIVALNKLLLEQWTLNMYYFSIYFCISKKMNSQRLRDSIKIDKPDQPDHVT